MAISVVMVDPISIAGPGINLLSQFFKYILDKVKEDSIRSDMATTLEIPINNVEKSLDSFSLALYRIMGAEMLADLMEPSNPTECAHMLLKEFFESYQEWTLSFKRLTKYFDAHRDELRVILNSHDMIIIEALIKAFETDSPDWNFLMEHGIMKNELYESFIQPKSFKGELNRIRKEMLAQNPSYNCYLELPRMDEVEQRKMVSEILLKSIMEKCSKKK